jgi:DnaK suppressor protein
MDADAARDLVSAEQERVRSLVDDLSGQLDGADGADGEHLDSTDDGTDTFEREKALAVLEQLERELAELQAALERIDEGTYGIDEVTGDPITPERLEAFPAARTNVDS